MSFSLPEYTKIDVGWGYAPDPIGGAHRLPSWFQGGRFAEEGKWREGRTTGVEEGKGGERGNGEGEVKGEVGE